jgi:hypothetical protein
MKIKGLDRERKRHKRQHGMRVDGASVKRIQADLARKREKGGK